MIDPKKAEFVIQILHGMTISTHNILVFNNDDSVWLQYYMGRLLEKPTYILCRVEDREFLDRHIKKDEIVKDIIELETFNQESIEYAMDKLMRVLRGDDQVPSYIQ